MNPYASPGQTPPPLPGQSSHPSPVAPVPPRSRVPIVFGVLHIIMAGTGFVVSAIIALFGTMIGLMIGVFKNGSSGTGYTGDIDDEAGAFFAVFFGIGVLYFLVSVLVLASGIGLLMRRYWGRIGSNIWAVLKLLAYCPLFFFALWADLTGFDHGEPFASRLLGYLFFSIFIIYPFLSLLFLNKTAVKKDLITKKRQSPPT